MNASVPPRRPVRIYSIDLFRDVKKMIQFCAIPFFLFMFAVHSINEERNTASSLRADFLYPNLNQYGYSTPSSSVNAPTALREWNAEGKAVPSLFYSPNKHNSVMHSTEKNVCRGSVVSPSDTCPSYENARLRLRKLPHGRVRYCASVRSHGVYLSFSTYSLTAFSAAVSRAGAKHRIHHTAHYE